MNLDRSQTRWTPRVGERVKYHAYIGGPVTSAGPHYVTEPPFDTEAPRGRRGTLVCFISGKSGYVAVDALSPWNPHNWCSKTCCVDPGGGPAVCRGEGHTPSWRCQYCGAGGTLAQLDQVECAYTYPPCASCGQTPLCAPDCAGMAAAIAAGGVIVDGKEHGRDH